MWLVPLVMETRTLLCLEKVLVDRNLFLLVALLKRISGLAQAVPQVVIILLIAFPSRPLNSGIAILTLSQKLFMTG